jgi:hypothetical protein
MFFLNLIFFFSDVQAGYQLGEPGINLGNRVSIGEARVLTGYGPPGYHQGRVSEGAGQSTRPTGKGRASMASLKKKLEI